jgi:hypothetical protein
MSVDLLKDPKHWQDHADAARRLADELPDLDARKTLLGIAASYDLLAVRARRRAGANSN